MSDEETRPVHVAYDCSTGEGTATPVTDDEWAAIKQGEKDAEAALAAEAQKSADLANQVQERNDPLLTELAKRAGII